MEHLHPPRVDVRQATQHTQQLQGRDVLFNYKRMIGVYQGSDGQNVLEWKACFEARTDATGAPATWLHLSLGTQMHLVCQRCLGLAAVLVQVERDFRFVATEALAQEQDDAADEDLLVLSRDFDLAELIEDEILLALPLVPRHDVCPVPVKLVAVDDNFAVTQQKPNPFAVLANLKSSD